MEKKREREIGTNVMATIEGDTLTLVIDLARDLGPSSTGKTRLIATTAGNVKLPGGARIGLNIYKPAVSAADGQHASVADVDARRPS